MRRYLGHNERGQSLAEVSFVSVFLILFVLMIFEGGVAFSTYVVLNNAAREGAMYASVHPELETLAETDAIYQRYVSVTKTEASSLAGWVDRDNETLFTIARPVKELVISAGSRQYYGIRVTVSYRLTTFTSTISLPFFGRFGLPDFWPMTVSTIMPIR